MDINFRGSHITIDFMGATHDNPTVFGNAIFQILKDSLKLATCHEVHSHLEILEGNTPSGFTCVVLLDESHMTAHSYSELGLLAIDVFTCGNSNPLLMANYIEAKIQELIPTAILVSEVELKRFPY